MENRHKFDANFQIWPWSMLCSLKYKEGGGEGNKGHILQIEMTEIHEIR